MKQKFRIHIICTLICNLLAFLIGTSIDYNFNLHCWHIPVLITNLIICIIAHTQIYKIK